MKHLSILLFCCCTTLFTFSQNNVSKWDLRRCVEYAMKNNISVKQAEVQARITALQHQANKLAIYPTANFSSGAGLQFGRSVDPTTNQFTTTQLVFNTFNFNTGMTVYNWGRLKNSIQVSDYSTKAALADIERAANDIGLNVATFYLSVLSNKQQVEIAQAQIALTSEQLENTRKRVNAGALPELSAAEFEARLASDSSNYYTAIGSFQQSIISLKGLLNLNMSDAFEVETPSLDKVPLDPIAELEPARLYQLALTLQPQQKVNDLRYKSAEYGVKVAKAGLYPTISLGGGLATNFASSTNKITGFSLGPASPNGTFVNVGGTNYNVLEPSIQLQQGKKSFGEVWDGYGVQLDNNFRQNIGFQINVPIFNNGNAKLNLENSKLQLKQADLAKTQANQQLQQDIYAAYTNAVTALQRFNASEKTVQTAERSYEFAKKRYETGLINSLDLITNQNNLLQAKLNRLTNQFEFVFRMKLLEFYKGQGLKL
jgi:outer membrane protein